MEVHGWDGKKKPSRGLLVAAQHKRMVAVSRAQEHLETNYWRGQNPKRVVAPLQREEEKKNQIKRSTRRGRIMYSANCQVFTCIPVILHWALRWNYKRDLPVELDDAAGETKPHSIWPSFCTDLLTGDILTKGYRTCVLRIFLKTLSLTLLSRRQRHYITPQHWYHSTRSHAAIIFKNTVCISQPKKPKIIHPTHTDVL